MNTRLESLGRFIKWAADMALIRPRSRLESVVNKLTPKLRFEFGVRQITYRITHSEPRPFCRFFFETPRSIQYPRRNLASAFLNAVTLPVFVCTALSPKKSIKRMRLVRKGPLYFQILTESHEDNSLAALRNSIIRGVESSRHNPIPQRVLVSGPGMDFFQTGQMILPTLAFAANNFRVLKLEVNVREVRCKTLPGESLYVFKDECLGLHLSHRPHRLRPHIPLVIVCAMFATKGKRLAGWAARNQFNPSLQALKIYVAHVIECWLRPMLNGMNAPSPVFVDSVAAPTVPLDNLNRNKPGLAHSHAESARSREQFKPIHARSPKKALRVDSTRSRLDSWHSQTTIACHPA